MTHNADTAEPPAPSAPSRSSRRAAALPTQATPPPPSHFQRRRVLVWLSLATMALVALPVWLSARLYIRGQESAQRLAALVEGTAWEQEQIETALLADWDSVGAAVNEAAYSPETPPPLKARCIEMMLINHPNERVATLTRNQRALRLALGYGDFLSQERGEDQFLASWAQYERAVGRSAREAGLPDAVRLRCIEMIQLKSERPAAVALAHYSRATRCYRAAGNARDPASRTDEEAGLVHDDANQYQTPDAGVPLGTPVREALERARDGFAAAQDQYQTLADATSGNEKVSAEDRARRASRLYLACMKFMPLDFYDEYKARQKKEQERQAGELKKSETEAARKKAEDEARSPGAD